MMQVEHTPLEGVLILRPRIFHDDRGHFLESYNEEAFRSATGFSPLFVQDNESVSKARVLRGLHFQLEPHAQGKLVRVLRGAVQDVVLDIRQGSATYGRHFSLRLDDKDKTMLWIPPGFAHGFLTLEDNSIFAYKCTAYYHPASERTILWNDVDLGIAWGVTEPIVSVKDRDGSAFKAEAWRVPRT